MEGYKREQVEAELRAIEEAIKELEILYRRYFSGDLDIPPEKERLQLFHRIRRLQVKGLPRRVDMFRLSMLESRFNTYCEMFLRKLRLIEMGKETVPGKGLTGDKDKKGELDPTKGIDFSSVDLDKGAVAIFKKLEQLKGKPPASDLVTFKNMINKRIAEVSKKAGTKRVVCKIVTEDGKVKLKMIALAKRRKK